MGFSSISRVGAGRITVALAVMELRSATKSDASNIARLHANSWRFAYRGALSDEYLDSEADRDRLNFWEARLGSPAPNQNVFVLADGDSLIGLTCSGNFGPVIT